MKIKYVQYSALINLGNYNNERFSFTAQVEEGDSIQDILESLKAKVIEHAGKNANDMYEEMRRGRAELSSLEKKVAKAREEWNRVAEFLKTQGIKPEATPMPIFNNLLPSVDDETYSQTDDFEEGEILEPDLER